LNINNIAASGATVLGITLLIMVTIPGLLLLHLPVKIFIGLEEQETGKMKRTGL
jgi:hypothetical protein